MNRVDKAAETQLRNIEKRTGKSLSELPAMVRSLGAIKHSEKVAHLKATLAMGHGDANTLVHEANKADEAPAATAAAAEGSDGPALDAIYLGNKASLRGLHEALIQRIRSLGAFEIAPKKGYLSLRRNKQFAMVGPATAKEIEIGLNSKTLSGGERLKALPAGGMCQFKVRISASEQIDQELIDWISSAYQSAG
jgi:hypothetical protein